MIPLLAPLAAKAAPLVAKVSIKGAIHIAKIVLPILALLGVAIYIHSLRTKLANRNTTVAELTTWQSDTVAAVRAEVPVQRRGSVTAKTASDEIHWLGRELRTINAALERQSQAVRKAASDATAAQNAAAEARKRAQERDKGREATRNRLNDPSRSTGLSAAEWNQL